VGIRSDQSQNRVDALRNRDPIAFLQRRSQALAQRSADLDKLAEAWQPFYNTLLVPLARSRKACLSMAAAE
jgi:hypothetical protein